MLCGMRRTGGVFLLLLASAGCGRRDDTDLRAAVAAMREAMVERGYAAAWECMDSGWKSKLVGQLRKLKEG
jgi:hypothetical protein